MAAPPITTSLQRYPASVRTSRIGRGGQNPAFFPLVFLLLLASSNILLINQRVAIQSGGQNIIGLRDVAFLLLLVLGMPSAKKLAELMRLGAIKICLTVVGLAVFGAVYAFVQERQPTQIADELIPLMAWFLPVIIAANLKTLPSIERCHRALVVLGVIVSVLSLAEAILKVPLVTGATTEKTLSEIGNLGARSTPSCWPLMMIAFGSLIVELSCRRWNSVTSMLSRAIPLSVVALASFMTQSRTLLVGMVVCLLGAMVAARTRRIRILFLCVCFGIPLMVTVTAQIGGSLLGRGFEDYYTKRYAVLFGIDSISEYAPTDGRSVEIRQAVERWPEWLWIGKGLASTYRDVMYTDEKSGDAQIAHNIVLYFGTRFGVIGIAVFLLFCAAAWSLFYRALHSPRPYNTVALCLGVDLAALVVTAMFGNVFAMTYMAPVAMTAFGCLVAWTVWSAQFRTAPRPAGTSPFRAFDRNPDQDRGREVGRPA
jgi:hypothetical protein